MELFYFIIGVTAYLIISGLKAINRDHKEYLLEEHEVRHHVSGSNVLHHNPLDKFFKE